MSQPKIQRNDPCACGSGKKYKHCCMSAPATPSATLDDAMRHHREGNLSQAAAIYRQLLAADPDHPDALHLLGTIAYQTGNLDQAEQLIGRSLRLRPLGAAHGNFGLLRHAQGRFDEAVVQFGLALAADPHDVAALCNLGQSLQAQGRLGDAIASYLQALALDPRHAIAYCNLGAALHDQGNLAEALECYEQALQLAPRYAMAHNNLGNLLRELGRTEDAIVHLRAALDCDPAYAMAYNNLGNILRDQGDPVAAIALYREALARNPALAEVFSNLLLTMHMLPDVSPETMFAEHLAFAARYEAPLKAGWPAHANSPDPHRRLKIGYVSGDFRDHPLINFVEPVLATHDKAQVEVFCYYNHHQEDAVTRRVAAYADHWLGCKSMSDQALAERIMADGIDILIDLSGHTAYNRLLVFARKPAPVQLNWIGYQSTTGLSAIDYRITDTTMDPVGLTERFHSETVLRMARLAPFQPSALCPPVNALPALSSPRFTLACLNQLAKIGDEAIALWSRILLALPHARLMLANVNDAATGQRLLAAFARHGVAEDQLVLHPRMSLADFLALHHQIDLALDSFPYNGGTTSLHAVSMGVPV
ncbi:MAG: tetratricopeptide repeat protein, partial [Massilia sp.]